MEWHVLAVAAGKFSESRRIGWFGHAIESVDGMAKSSGDSRSNDLPGARLRAAASDLEALSNGWAAWSLRT